MNKTVIQVGLNSVILPRVAPSIQLWSWSERWVPPCALSLGSVRPASILAAGRGGTQLPSQAQPGAVTDAERAAPRGPPPPGLVRAEPGYVHFAET